MDENGKSLSCSEGHKVRWREAEDQRPSCSPSPRTCPELSWITRDAKVTGRWVTVQRSDERTWALSISLHAPPAAQVVYPVTFPKRGKYEVRMTIAPHSNRAPQALVIVRHKDGEESFRIDQRLNPGSFNKRGSDRYFQSLGFFEFPAGVWDAVEISGSGGGGMVVADAVQFLAADRPAVIEDAPETAKTKAEKPAETTERTVHVRVQPTANCRTLKRRGSLAARPQDVLTTVPDDQRKGILTHPIWLVSHSDAMDNHAILRGKWIRERLLGGAIADVPITVDAMLPDEPEETLRHRMRVTREEQCWKCHRKMDPLGLPFEMFNHAGFFALPSLVNPSMRKVKSLTAVMILWMAQ